MVRQFSNSSFFRGAELILTFSPLPEETDISGIRALCEEEGKRIAYPKVLGKDMEFFEVFPGEALSEGAFHLMEPVIAGGKEPIIPERAICLVPGVVFDGFGNRYGYGKGYYDRYFARFPELLRIGVCFAQQISEKPLPVEPQDMRVHYLLTQNGIAGCSTGYGHFVG